LHLLLALRSGEPNRIAMSMALLGGTLSRPAGEAGEGPEVLCSRARALATAGDEPYPLAMADFGAGTVALMHRRWKASVEFLARSEDLLARRCVAVTWELGIVRDLIQVAGFMLGRFTELPSVVSTLLAEADARADKYLATCLRTHRTANIAWLIADQPDEASRQLAEGMKHWSRDQFLTQHYWELSSNVQIDLYLGHGQIAWARLSERFEHMEKSIMSRTQIIRVECLYMRSRCALAANLERPDEALVRLAEKDARGLLAEGTHYAVPTGQLILAAVARAGGREAEAMALLRAADVGFLAADMVFHAAISRRRLGELRGGQAGAAMVLDADAVLAGCGAKRPERMANVFGPGF
jgi:eukaryotic-like serine/threonine-protein kinase